MPLTAVTRAPTGTPCASQTIGPKGNGFRPIVASITVSELAHGCEPKTRTNMHTHTTFVTFCGRRPLRQRLRIWAELAVGQNARATTVSKTRALESPSHSLVSLGRLYGVYRFATPFDVLCLSLCALLWSDFLNDEMSGAPRISVAGASTPLHKKRHTQANKTVTRTSSFPWPQGASRFGRISV